MPNLMPGWIPEQYYHLVLLIMAAVTLDTLANRQLARLRKGGSE